MTVRSGARRQHFLQLASNSATDRRGPAETKSQQKKGVLHQTSGGAGVLGQEIARRLVCRRAREEPGCGRSFALGLLALPKNFWRACIEAPILLPIASLYINAPFLYIIFRAYSHSFFLQLCFLFVLLGTLRLLQPWPQQIMTLSLSLPPCRSSRSSQNRMGQATSSR